ncbi:hypothetical protein Sp245p_19115 (plasmid) [Azospirillum baldaniorum]|uniref:PRC-barrel domain-containing protein n=2 Tax=Azospirillum TaxID=191 RepID=A0A9P1JV43_9PROT|nr:MULTISPECIES: hypothetical protein [Azospirillum]TWA73909.1 hypothetical protein FBZ85_114136 [Azospirillum brasilense]AWJ91911.1 hypothetical protein Sp245p_19115 [Azospirillum baldaniorum]KAA1052986.1 hypothetical protein FH063_003182 [Azospirillum argentinense]NUB07275.1 hypothetical protein [Azospirillum baldaniorum]CCD00331.1 conserved exported protein of unknown function [Azospirillum baldaniorum]
MRTPILPLPILPLLCATVLMTASACAQHEDRRYAAAEPMPAAPTLVGLVVLSEDGTRRVGVVHDVVVGTDSQPVEIVVASGHPAVPKAHLVAVSPANTRYAPEQAAVILVDLTPEQFAALPPRTVEDRMISMRLPGPTNWSGVTSPR